MVLRGLARPIYALQGYEKTLIFPDNREDFILYHRKNIFLWPSGKIIASKREKISS
jgi:hypothetical protein